VARGLALLLHVKKVGERKTGSFSGGKMHHAFRLAAVAALLLVAAKASAQAVNFDFEDNTDQGWGSSFGADADVTFPIVTNSVASGGNGTKYIRIARTGFQNGAYDANGPTFVAAMNAAALAPTLYQVSYDYYLDTSLYAAAPGTFLQLGAYINTGSGWYSQDFSTPNQVSFSGAQLASGQVFAGHVDELISLFPPDAAHGGAFSSQAGLTFYRLGLIENGNGTLSVDFDNISVHPAVPEPATLGLLAMGLPALALRRRRAA
jgi:hypothetical protein